MHRDRPFDAVYTAPRQRVRETTAPICTTLGMTAMVEPRLSGPRRGEADGKPWTEIWADFGRSPADQPDRRFAPGAESWNTFLARVTHCLETIIKSHQDGRFLVVAHAETVEAAHALLLGLPANASARLGFSVAHASLSHWSFRAPSIGTALDPASPTTPPAI